jgi:PAS domain S-box-containing protein
MNAVDKFRSVRFWLPALLLLLTVGCGAVQYVYERRTYEAQFEADFRRDEMLRAGRLQAEIERWVQRNDLDMAQAILAERGVLPELRSALFLDAENRVLASTRREYLGKAFEPGQLDVSALDPARLRERMQTARRTQQGLSFYADDRDGLVICLPTSLPLRAGELEARHGGLLLLSYDFQLKKAVGLRYVQAEFLTYFAGLAIIALVLGVCLHFLITRRLERLQRAMADFAAGKPVAGMEAKSGDEISELVAGFNDMAAAIGAEMELRKRTEVELRRAAAEVRDLYDHAPCGYHSVDENGVFLQVNDTELQWLGRSRDEVLGRMRFLDFVAEPRRAAVEEEFDRFKKLGWARNVEFEVVGRDGVSRPVLLSSVAVYDEAGRYVMSRSTVTDIADRKRAEEALAASERRMARCLANVPGFTYTFRRTPDGHYSFPYTSPGIEKLYGLKPEDVREGIEAFHSMAHPEDRPRIEAAIEEAAQTMGLFRQEFRICRPGCPERWLEASSIPERDADGSILWHGIMLDITERKRAEQSISLLSFALNSVSEAAFLVDKAGRFHFVNEEACRVLGYTREELLGIGVSDIDPEVTEEAWAAHWSKLETLGSLSFERNHRTRDGRVFPVEINANFIEYGGQAYNLALVRDISARRLAEEKINHLASIVESTDDAVIGKALDGTIVSWNRGAERIYGFTAAEIVGRPISLLVPEDRVQELEDIMDRLKAGETVEHFETTRRHKDGRVINVALTVSPLRDAGGRLVGASTIAHDISERKRAEETLRRNERQLRTLFENLPDCISRFDREGRLLFVSPSVTKVFGAAADSLGRRLSEIGEPGGDSQNAMLEDLIRRAAEEGSPNSVEAQWETREGPRCFDILHVPEKDESGNVVSVLGIAHDITMRKSVENMLRFIAQLGWSGQAEGFLPALARHLGEVLRVDYVIIDKVAPEPGVAETAALFARGEIMPNMRYALKGTPCENVIGKRLCYYPERVRELFPEDLLLQEMGVESYAGIPLWDSSGRCMGLIAAMDGRPIRDEEAVKQLLQVAAISAAAFLERERSDLLLRQREREFSTLANNIPDLVARYDSELNCVFVNRAWEQTTGLTAEETLQALAANVPVSPPLIAGLSERVRRVLAEGGSEKIELSWVNIRGECRFHEHVVVPEYDHEGRIVSALAVARDVTERKQSEEALRRVNRELRAITDCNEVLMRATDESALLNEVCRIVCEKADYRMAWVGFAGSDAERSVRPVAWAGAEEGYLRAIRIVWADTEDGRGPAGVAVRTGRSMCSQDFETDPTVAPWREEALRRGYRSCIALPLKDESDAVFGVFTIYSVEPNAFTPKEVRLLEELAADLAFGISVLRSRIKRKEAEDALWESTERLRLVLDNMPAFVFWKDRESVYLGCNRLFACNAGLNAPEKIVGLTDFDLPWTREETEGYRADDRRVMELGTPKLDYEENQHTADGRVVWLRTSKVPLKNAQGEVIGVLGTYADVTERKRAEEELRTLNLELDQRVRERTAQLEAANKEMEAFSYSVSHDLRAPLRSIDGFSKALLEDYSDKLDDEGQEDLRCVRAASQRMAQLIDDILQLSRISRARLQVARVDLSALAESVLEELRRLEPERRVESAIEPGCVAMADGNLMRIVLENLLGNAWKFTAAKEAARIEFGRTMRDGAPVFYVRDNGAGFDMQYASKLFGAFQRLHTASEFPGTGIGLASVQRIIHRHGGEVWIEGRLDEGATAFFSLPQTANSS